MRTERGDVVDSGLEADELPGSKWWILIGFLAMLVPLAFLFGIVQGIVAAVAPDLGMALLLGFLLVALVAKLVSPIAVHFDRRYMSAHTEWSPSRWYYLTFLGGVGLILSALYVYKRHKHLGVP